MSRIVCTFLTLFCLAGSVAVAQKTDSEAVVQQTESGAVVQPSESETVAQQNATEAVVQQTETEAIAQQVATVAVAQKTDTAAIAQQTDTEDSEAVAQQTDSEIDAQEPDTERIFFTDHSILPVLGYSSDFGWFAGGVYRRISYREIPRPILTTTEIDIRASTKGNVFAEIEYERPMTFGREVQSRLMLKGVRHLRSTYFGLGNDTEFSRSAYDDGFYAVEERTLAFRYEGKRNLVSFGGNGLLDLVLDTRISYSNPLSRGEETLFAQSDLPGKKGGWVNQAGLGLVLENRDDQVNPALGYLIGVNGLVSGKAVGSRYHFQQMKAEMRGYFSPLRDVVIAQKVEYRNSAGDVPYWELPALGHSEGLRGYSLNRFRGDQSVLHILELRTWLFDVMDDQIRLGGQLFMDTGRVFSDQDRSSRLTSDLKQTFGIGAAVSIPEDNFVLRADLAFSDETFRFYLGIGYLF